MVWPSAGSSIQATDRSLAGSPAVISPKSITPLTWPSFTRMFAGCRSPCSHTGGARRPPPEPGPARLRLVVPAVREERHGRAREAGVLIGEQPPHQIRRHLNVGGWRPVHSHKYLKGVSARRIRAARSGPPG